jgi:hypothetical protein
MKNQFFFLLLLALTFKGFSQEKTIEIQAQKEFLNAVILTPACGKGNDVELPFAVFWDKKNETLKIDFKSNKVSDKILFFFPQRLSIPKGVMKVREDVWFAKEVKKCQRKKTVNPCVDYAKLVNIEEPELYSLRIGTLDFSDKNAAKSFLFEKAFKENGDVVIPFHFYIASKETFKERKLKIEYEAIFTLIIKKRAETVAPQKEITPATPKETPPAAPKETVNCKTLYKANEQLAELLLDIKNSTPTNLTQLKQKYATIKKSVAGAEFQKCKEEYKAYESLCSKIDNRLK